MGRKLMGFGTAWLERQVFVFFCVRVWVPVVLPVCLCEQCVLNVGPVSLAYVWEVCVWVYIYASAYFVLHFQSTSRIVAFLSLCSCVLGDQLNAMCHINRCESYGHLTTASNQTAVICYTHTQMHTHADTNIHCNRGQKNVWLLTYAVKTGSPANTSLQYDYLQRHKHIEAQRHTYTHCQTPPG